MRWNPNLYKCGKVCLSLLGTWSGARGESWDPVASSMLQVSTLGWKSCASLRFPWRLVSFA